VTDAGRGSPVIAGHRTCADSLSGSSVDTQGQRHWLADAAALSPLPPPHPTSYDDIVVFGRLEDCMDTTRFGTGSKPMYPAVLIASALVIAACDSGDDGTADAQIAFAADQHANDSYACAT